MATPTFRTAGAWSFTANSVANPTTLTPGAPSGKTVGDLLILVCSSRSNTATVATPTGWGLVSGFPKRSAATSGGTFYVFTRIADGSATDTPSPNWSGLTTGTSGDSAGAGILCYSAGTLTDSLDGTVAVSDLGNQGSTSTITGLTTALPESLVVAIAIKILDFSGTNSSTWAQRVSAATSTGTGHGLEIADHLMVDPGASGSSTVTWAVATAGQHVLGVAIGFAAVMPTITDTGATVTDVPAIGVLRLAADTAVTVTDSIFASETGGGTNFPVFVFDRAIGPLPVVLVPLG